MNIVPRPAIQQLECFHLLFLRLLESRVDRAIWVVKGGVNLRLWFGSIRYSQDLDIDVLRGRPHSLAEKLDRLLGSRVFRDMLEAQGLRLLGVSKPKQTGPTQRWKLRLAAEGELRPLHTRLEFSRRGGSDSFALEPVREQIVRPYGILQPTANHYTASAALRQKILALAMRSQTQARDVWDVEFLLRVAQADARPLSPSLERALTAALDHVRSLRFDVFRAQVIPYLAPDHRELHDSREAWERMRELVLSRLSEAR